jgi:gluconate 5-dehydrogenase
MTSASVQYKPRSGAVQKGIELFDLFGKRALVTGSSQGIGFSLAQGLAAAGAEIVLNGRDAGKLAAAARVLSQTGMTPQTLVFDTTDAKAVRAAIDAFEQSTGPIDILVNNAGMQHRGPLEHFDPEMFELLMRTNVSGAFNVGQAVARHMIARGRGKIINCWELRPIPRARARSAISPKAWRPTGLTMGWRSMPSPRDISIRRSTPHSSPMPSFQAGSGDARRPAAGASWRN